MEEKEEESKEVQTGFTVKKYVKIARHLEVPEPEYLAKRRKGLPSQYANGQVAQPALRETKIKKLDAEGNIAVYKVLVPEGQAVEGEVQPTDAAIEVAPATAAPGTIVEGLGVVNAEGVVVANDILQQTPPRRRPPPPKKKVKRAGPGRGKKKVVFAEGAMDQEMQVSTPGNDLLAGIKREEGSVAMSDGGDTPMADAGGDDDEGSGEEGSDDEDQDMDHTSAPTTPSRLPVAATSAPAMEDSEMTDLAPLQAPSPLAEPPVIPSPEESLPLEARNSPTLPPSVPDTSEPSAVRDASGSPDLPLSVTSHSQQNSLDHLSNLVATTDAKTIEPAFSEVGISSEEPSTIPAPVPEPEPVLVPVAAPELEIVPVAEIVAEPAAKSIAEPGVEPIAEPISESIAEPVAEPVAELVAEVIAEPVAEPIVVFNSESIPLPPNVPSAPPSEPDLLGSLERQLEKDSEEMAG